MLVFSRQPGRSAGFRDEGAGETLFTYGLNQAPGGFDYSPRSRNAEVISLMEWFLILTVRVPLAIYLVAQMQ